jgi:hypothetical protein
MGREAITRVEIGSEAADVRALLESTELILRGDIRRRFPRDRIADVHADGDALRFICEGETVALHLGAGVSGTWAKAIATPPPSLRAKLGLANGARAYRIGGFEDAVLDEAMAGTLVDTMADADMMIACLADSADLDAALAVHAAKPAVPVWAVYPKGAGVAFGDGEIRSLLRARGFRDSKSCSVSTRLTATRYGLPPAT